MAKVSSLKVAKPKNLEVPMNIPSRLLLGPGPSNVSPKVLEAMRNPLLGHLHPEFTKIMDDVKAGLRYLFQTESKTVFCVSGTGHAGMEAVLINILEDDDVVLIAKNGIWGERAAGMVKRQEGNVKILEKEAGEAFSLEEFEKGLQDHKPTVLFVVHAESSTGVLQPLEGLGSLCHNYGTLLVVDTVASIGGVPFYMDDWEVDIVYTGSQKVLSCPPSLSPVAISDKAMDKINNRSKPVRSFYFDFGWLANYWGCDSEPRRYHHTGPVSSIYALREALSNVCEEGLESFWDRHSTCAKILQDGLKKQGLQLFVSDPQLRAPTINTVCVPPGIQWQKLCSFLMQRFQVEVSGGLGPTAGKVWRIGLMGENAKKENVHLILELLQLALLDESVVGGNKL